MRRSDFSGPHDLRDMQEMCTRLWSQSARFHPGQLAWSRHYQDVDPASPAPGEAISLWREGEDVVGFGWAEAPDWLELQVDPAHPEVAGEVVAWFEDWSEAETQSALLMEGDPAESAFTAAGFTADLEAPFFTHHHLDLADLPPQRALGGYHLRHLAGDDPGDVAARAACHAAAWADFGPSKVSASAYAALTATWPYRPDLDWVAVDADGTMAGSALVWLDPALGVGLVEPVGVVPQHRGHGLAAAVTLAALHRLRALGARSALVTPRGDADYPRPRRLYQSLGFRPGARTVTMTRALG